MRSSKHPDGIGRLEVLVAIGVTVAGLSSGGCASSSTATSEAPPSDQALAASRERVQGSVAQAADQADASGPFLLSARLNPPRCGAPEFEVFAHGTWTRAFVVGSRSVRGELETLREEFREESGFRVLRIHGRFQGKRRAENGLKYPVFRVAAIESKRQTPQGSSDERSPPRNP